MINSNLKNKIINGDSLKELKKIPDESFDLIFADPPYNLQLRNQLIRPDRSKVDAVNDKWDQFKSFKIYDEFTLNWLKECKRVLKKNGNISIVTPRIKTRNNNFITFSFRKMIKNGATNNSSTYYNYLGMFFHYYKL